MGQSARDTRQQQGDVLLLKIPGVCLTAAQLGALGDELRQGRDDVVIQGYAAADAADGPQTYVYCRLPAGDAPAGADAIRARALRARPDATVRWLRRISSLPGFSHGRAAPWHYIVETDVLPQAEQDLNDWYDQEHLPGLASVPGTVRAERYACEESSPRYHACYDLETVETFGSPPWLAVRASAWSDRVRPSFRNTKRTMFKAIA
ncbi:ABM domain-containing protein [Bordetella sputigena]|uniref:hypothetical protein n=1 Tax=Bordetella sputigena TaxID=1416810 RepID=UPI0039EEFD1A